MKNVIWWYRIVGGFYLLMALMNMYFLFGDSGDMIRGMLPYPADEIVVKAFLQGWSPFAFELVALATFMLWASRSPLRYLGAVWLIVWLEFWHGIVSDIYLIANGYDLVSYLIFIAIHIAIIVTGVIFVRQAEAEAGRTNGQ